MLSPSPVASHKRRDPRHTPHSLAAGCAPKAGMPCSVHPIFPPTDLQPNQPRQWAACISWCSGRETGNLAVEKRTRLCRPGKTCNSLIKKHPSQASSLLPDATKKRLPSKSPRQVAPSYSLTSTKVSPRRLHQVGGGCRLCRYRACVPFHNRTPPIAAQCTVTMAKTHRKEHGKVAEPQELLGRQTEYCSRKSDRSHGCENEAVRAGRSAPVPNLANPAARSGIFLRSPVSMSGFVRSLPEDVRVSHITSVLLSGAGIRKNARDVTLQI